jgi:GR25 family glycosyltransferase involved in LPS biosynthesis
MTDKESSPIVHVITLERTPERREAYLKKNSHINSVFCKAIDGKKINVEEYINKNVFERNLPYSEGAYGAAISHLSLWEKTINEDKPITIAEDDAIFRLDFNECFNKIYKELDEDWDLSILSFNVMRDISPTVMLFNQAKLRESTELFQKVTTKPHLIALDKCAGSVSYTISPRGAKKFKNLCFPLKNFSTFFPVLNKNIANSSLDIVMAHYFNQTSSFVSFPPLVVTKNEHEISTIQKQP